MTDEFEALTTEQFGAHMGRLAAEVKAYRAESVSNRAHHFIAGLAYSDPSIASEYAKSISDQLLAGVELNSVDRFFACYLLNLVGCEPNLALAFVRSASGGSGRPRQQMNSITMASSVPWAIEERGATSVEKAWEIVAEEFHMSIESVKAAWIKWKGLVLDVQSEEAGEDAWPRLKSLMAANKDRK